jgi:hypothetical protein
VNKIPEKITYVYTSFGTNNSAVRDYIAASWDSPKAKLVPGSGIDTRMSSTVAVRMLPWQARPEGPVVPCPVKDFLRDHVDGGRASGVLTETTACPAAG